MVDSEAPLPNDLPRKEDQSRLNEQSHQTQKDENPDHSHSLSDSDCEYLETVLKKETNFQLGVKEDRGWLKRARLEIVRWMLQSTFASGFHFSTAYLSVIYFDRFFSRMTTEGEDLWSVGIISVACVSLAAKMEERLKAPPLSIYCRVGTNIDESTVQKMELLVLSTLEWKMNCVTPSAYLHHFVTKFCGESGHQGIMIARAVGLISAVMGEINAAEQRPSVVAAAAVLAAYNIQLTKETMEIKINDVPSWGSLEKEHTFSCYKLMQKFVLLRSNSEHLTTSGSAPARQEVVDSHDRQRPKAEDSVKTKEQ